MYIILKEDVQNLGYKDEVVFVRDGYGRNYLIPQGKAVIASESAKKVLAETLKQRAHKLEKIKKDAQSVAEKMADVKLTIVTKCSESGKVYGSVNNIQLAEELAKLGIEVDRKTIIIKEPAKEVGNFTAVVKLHKEIVVELPYEVVAEQ